MPCARAHANPGVPILSGGSGAHPWRGNGSEKKLIQCVPRAFRNDEPQTFRTVVDTVCRDNPPLECSVCLNELPVCVRVRMRVGEKRRLGQ